MRPSLRFLAVAVIGWVGVRAAALGILPGAEMFSIERSEARVPPSAPVTVTSRPSRATMAVSWPRVAPARRCWVNSRRRAAVAAISVFTSMTATNSVIMPITTKFRVLMSRA